MDYNILISDNYQLVISTHDRDGVATLPERLLNPTSYSYSRYLHVCCRTHTEIFKFNGLYLCNNCLTYDAFGKDWKQNELWSDARQFDNELALKE